MEVKESGNTSSEEENIKVEALPEDYPQYDLSFKLIFIGDSGVGKSCLTKMASKDNRGDKESTERIEENNITKDIDRT